MNPFKYLHRLFESLDPQSQAWFVFCFQYTFFFFGGSQMVLRAFFDHFMFLTVFFPIQSAYFMIEDYKNYKASISAASALAAKYAAAVKARPMVAPRVFPRPPVDSDSDDNDDDDDDDYRGVPLAYRRLIRKPFH